MYELPQNLILHVRESSETNPVKYEAARTNGSRDIRITDGQIPLRFRKKSVIKY